MHLLLFGFCSFVSYDHPILVTGTQRAFTTTFTELGDWVGPPLLWGCLLREEYPWRKMLVECLAYLPLVVALALGPRGKRGEGKGKKEEGGGRREEEA